ncbi:MAG: NAD-dependent succinate-semialdehyde dehydrogenase [Gemmatimonadetes bacterium]|nr:NAD-dependent succinate-semialdehyde dehydrogenase [Gemmatimonadota bacterium]
MSDFHDDLALLPGRGAQTWIGGAWRAAHSGRTFAVHRPATGAHLADVADCTPHDVDEAVTAAQQAWPAWRARTAAQRAQALHDWHAAIVAHTEPLARLMTHESGKVIAESRGEVAYGAAFVAWFAEEARRAYGDTIPAPSADRRIVVIRQPVGVSAAITPWNFPLAMVTRKVAPALAAGCTVVLKPAAETPLTALALAVLAERAGVPAGVLNVVPSSDAAGIGEALCADVRVRKLSFTGSTAVGKRLMAQCAPNLTRLSLELGGNAPFLVFDDADLDPAVDGAIASKFRNTGQTCVCVNRIYVQAAVHDAFVERLAARVAALRSGDGLDERAQVGPLIHARALEKVQTLVADAVSQGASVVTGGEARGGLFYAPTVLRDATPAMRLAKEEVFGPVAPVFRFHTEAEAVAMANATEYGLAAYLYSRDIGRCWRVAEALESGMVGINDVRLGTEVAPFGGVKHSGFGREGSRHGMEAYEELKYLNFGGI